MDAIILSSIFELKDLAVALLTAQAPYEWGWRMHPMWGWGWGLGMMVMIALFWGAIIVACVMGVGWLRPQNNNYSIDSALTILGAWFARGEIEKD